MSRNRRTELVALCLVPLGCTHVGASRGDVANNAVDRELIDVVAFETGCPPERIEVVERPDGKQRQTYAVEACGQQVEYERTGNVYHTPDTRL